MLGNWLEGICMYEWKMKLKKYLERDLKRFVL